MSESEKEHPSFGRREFLKKAVGVGAAVALGGGVLEAINKVTNNYSKTGDPSPETPTPVLGVSNTTTPTELGSPVSTQFVQEVTATPVSTPDVTPTSVQPSPTATGVATPEPSPTPNPTELPLNPTIEDIVNSKELPYQLHSYEVFEKGKDTQFFTFVFGVDDEMYTRSQGCRDAFKDDGKCDSIDKILPNPDAFPGTSDDELKKKVGANLEQFYLQAFLQNLKFSYPDKYGNVSLDEFKIMIEEKKVDPLKIYHTFKNKTVTPTDGAVDLNNASTIGIFLTASPVQFYPNSYEMGYGTRILDMQENSNGGALIVEINEPDAYLIASQPSNANATYSATVFSAGLALANVPGQQGNDSRGQIIMPQESFDKVHGLVDRLGTTSSKNLLFPPPSKQPLFKLTSGSV